MLYTTLLLVPNSRSLLRMREALYSWEYLCALEGGGGRREEGRKLGLAPGAEASQEKPFLQRLQPGGLVYSCIIYRVP